MFLSRTCRTLDSVFLASGDIAYGQKRPQTEHIIADTHRHYDYVTTQHTMVKFKR
jgi:hypothetical protein